MEAISREYSVVGILELEFFADYLHHKAHHEHIDKTKGVYVFKWHAYSF